MQSAGRVVRGARASEALSSLPARKVDARLRAAALIGRLAGLDLADLDPPSVPPGLASRWEPGLANRWEPGLANRWEVPMATKPPTSSATPVRPAARRRGGGGFRFFRFGASATGVVADAASGFDIPLLLLLLVARLTA
jgi:hypothetical protein